jgi:hypothetical protein
MTSCCITEDSKVEGAENKPAGDIRFVVVAYLIKVQSSRRFELQ